MSREKCTPHKIFSSFLKITCGSGLSPPRRFAVCSKTHTSVHVSRNVLTLPVKNEAALVVVIRWYENIPAFQIH